NERVTENAVGLAMCDSTPTKAQVARYPTPLPYNHVELVAGSEAVTDERLFVAAFDAETDPTEGRLGIGSLCESAERRGTKHAPVMYDYSRTGTVQEALDWCLTQDEAGTHWWTMSFLSALSGP